MPDTPIRPTPGSRVRTPTILQMEVVECGAAALAIVLAHHGKFLSLEELRVACGVSRDGTNAGNIVKAARSYGLIAKGYSREVREVAALPMPVIAYWNFTHFVVVEGFEKDTVYLNDPAVGPRTVSEREFSDSFTGLVLVFEKGPDFTPGGHRPGLVQPLRRRLAGSETGLLFLLLASLGLMVPGVVTPVFARVFVDHYLVARQTEWIGGLLLGMALTAVLRPALTWIQQMSLLRLETKLALSSSFDFIQHVLRLPVEFFNHRYAGEVGARVEMNDRIAQLLSRELAASVLNLLMAAFFVAMMTYFDPVLTLVGVATAALNIAALILVSRRRRDMNVRLLQERAKLMGTSMSGLSSIETLKATGSESDFFSRWSGSLAKLMGAEQELSMKTLWLEVLPPFLASVNTLAILGVGSLRVMSGQLTAGMLVAFQSLMVSFMEPVERLVGLGASIQEVEGELKRLDDVLGHPEDPQLEQEAGVPEDGDPPRLSGQLELRDVTYGYSVCEPPLVDGVSLFVRPGARIALVGPSASGKSTVAKLICGIFQPWSGEVLLDGAPRSSYPRIVCTRSIAMVEQDFFICEGTVRDLLTMWDPTVPEEELLAAARDACIHEEIAARPGGYDSQVEEGGANFSMGQRQRLEIARALVGDPRILVLDEATSSLDPVTERTIDENLRRRGCTCVIAAHRLSTVRDCDEILVMDRGHIVQRGRHDMLLAVEGLYRKLVQS